MKIIKMIYHLYVDNKLSTLAGSLCFFILINGGSYFFLLVSISGYLSVDTKEILLSFINIKAFTDLVNYFYDYNRNISSSIFLLFTSIYSSSTLYYQFINIIEYFTKAKEHHSYRKRIRALILVPIVLVLYLFLLVFIAKIRQLVGNTYYLLITATSILITIIILNLIALKTIDFKYLYKGILGSFLYVVIFTFFFLIYLNISINFKIVYGAFSFYIIVLFYLYVSVIGILYGIAFNCQKIEEYKPYKYE